jgi:hypothetical protein
MEMILFQLLDFKYGKYDLADDHVCIFRQLTSALHKTRHFVALRLP